MCDDDEFIKAKLRNDMESCANIGNGCQDFDFSDEYLSASGTKCCCDTDL